MTFKPLKRGATDLTGMKFGYLTVLGPGDIVYSGTGKNGKPLSRRKWRVHCALCNRDTQILGQNLKNNERVESCGDCGRKRVVEIAREGALSDEGELLVDIARRTGLQYMTVYQRYMNGDRGERLRRPVVVR